MLVINDHRFATIKTHSDQSGNIIMILIKTQNSVLMKPTWSVTKLNA